MKKTFASLICVSLLCLNCQQQKVEQRTVTKAADQALISEVIIAGNRGIPTETIKARLQTHPGERLNEATIKADVERLRASGEFTDVRVSDEAGRDGGRILIFEVREKFFEVPEKSPTKTP
jgi:outer membrane protein assembly factor BamA